MSVEGIDQYVCIECLQKVDSLFKIYQDGFKDIIQCVNILISIVICQKKFINKIIILVKLN